MSSSQDYGSFGRHFKTAPEPVSTPRLVERKPVPPVQPVKAVPVQPVKAVRQTPARQHVKVSADLAQEMRDAVWFLCAHGRPRVKLNELLDEALELWLHQAKARYNNGEDFPEGGPLR